ncbi:MAG: hypothetical protein SGBAC_010081 [Bacillariaceae sp.]
MADTDEPETPQTEEKRKVDAEDLKTPEAGERKKADKDTKSPSSSGSRSRRSPHSSRSSPRSGHPRARRGGDRRKERGDDREHRSGGHRYRSSGERRERRHSDRKDDEKSPRSERRRSGHKEDHKSHRSERRHSERKEDDKSQISERDRDVEAKRRGRRNDSTPATPGASSVTDSASLGTPRRTASAASTSGLPPAPLTKEERMANRTREEQEAKRRAKEGRKSGSGRSRPGTASVGNRDQEAKRRAKEERSRGSATPGAQMASSRGDDAIREKQKMQGRPGASSSKAADNKKSLENVKLEYDGGKSSEPAKTDAPEATIGEDGEVAVEAVAIDEEAEENERMRVLEDQNRALADRMEQMMAPVPNNQDEEQRIEAEKEERKRERKLIEERAKKKKQKNICMFILLLLIAGGGTAAYFLTKSDDAAVTPADVSEDIMDVAAPVIESQTPTLHVSQGPSISPTIDTYDAPSLEDCIRISSGLPVQGQENLNTSPFRMEFDVTIKDPNLSTDTWVPSLKKGFDEILIPALAGCPISTNRRLGESEEHHPQSRLRKVMSTSLEEEQQRELQEVESPIRYAIANANSNIDPDKDVTEDCEIKRTGCSNVKVVMEIFLKGVERPFDIITLIAQTLRSLQELEDAGNRRLENDPEQRHHRKLLFGILGLDPAIFDSIGYRGIQGMDPTTSPSVSPSQAPSMVPSIVPSGVPSVSPSNGPSQSLSAGPTETPSMKPTPGPTPPPTPGPTAPPTPPPTPGPTAPPTPPPTPGPTPPPTPGPTPEPTPATVLAPTAPAPTYVAPTYVAPTYVAPSPTVGSSSCPGFTGMNELISKEPITIAGRLTILMYFFL